MASMSVLFSCFLNQSLLETIFFRRLRKKIGHLNTLKENLNKNFEDLSIFWIGRMKCAEYELWLKEVSEFRSQTTDIKQKFEKYSSSNFCPHVSLLIKLNKSVTSATEKVIILSKSLDVNERSTPDVPVGLMTDPGAKAILSNYPTILKKVLEIERGDFLDIFPDSSETMLVPKLRAGTSTVQILHIILEHLSSADTHMIAICGDNGIGKTTMLRILRSLPKTKEMFEIIIWVTVSRSQSTRKVQDEIAKQLSVRVTADEPDDRVAMRLFNRLVGMKFLLLLDDVLEDIDLMKVGIPNLIHSAGCKVVYSSLHVEVCRNMGKEEVITMLHRSEEESWQLFNDVLGDSMDNNILAKEIIGKCGGLSLAIETVGQALRMSIMRCNPHPWDEVLRELTSPVIPAFELGISSAVVTLSVLKIGYNHLGGDDAKNCFLYSALYTDMIIAEELIDHWVMEGYIGKSETLARSRELGHNMLQQLIETTLLRRGGKQGQVEMHELHRDMALSIATGFLVWNGGSYPDAALDGQWECANRVSLVRCGLRNLPNSPNCPELLTLLLQGNRMLRVIPKDFFARMPQLCILDLSETRIISLPCSISALVNLKALLLRNCERLALLPPEVGRLTQLEFIDLCGTRTSYLPDEFMKLSRLRTLQVTFYGYFENEKQPQIIPDNTISILLDLEELYIRVEPDDIRWEHIVEAVTKELSGLQKLTAIRFYFPTAELCGIFIKESVPWREERLLKFHITIGRRVRRLVTRVTGFGRWSEGWDRKLRFTNGDGPVPDEVKEVLRRANELYLDSHKTMKSLSEFGLGNMRSLKGCLVAECDEIEVLVKEDEQSRDEIAPECDEIEVLVKEDEQSRDEIAPECDEIEVLVKEDEQSRDEIAPEMMFTNLQYLSVQYLLKLVSIWHQPIPGGSFSGLRTLIVGGCSNLEIVIPKEMALNLSNLEELRVFSCRKVKIIIKGSGSEPMLPKLKYLVLFSMPELKRICEEASKWPSLQVVYASSCPKLTRLPLLLDGIPSLGVIGGEENWWHSLTWEEKFMKDDLEPIFYPV
ncbi:Disease resistance protein [Acorus gramineus]|uniref:Disease resistance protein n=1 Tax=Acorus gramineus TaxID=55184 RepID=A0AAV9B2J8_ACOGR|nr:Disease resistance protein [Acorus gramineus]